MMKRRLFGIRHGKGILCCTALLMTVLVMGARGQTFRTHAAKVILVVQSENQMVSDLLLFDAFEKMREEEIVHKYRNCDFYVGRLTGDYEMGKDGLAPAKGTIITIYTANRYQAIPKTLPGEGALPGTSFNLGEIKAKVLQNKKGELTVTVED